MFQKMSEFAKENSALLLVAGWDALVVVTSVATIVRTVSYVATNKALVASVAEKAVEIAPAAIEKVVS